MCYSSLIHRAHLWCFGLVSLVSTEKPYDNPLLIKQACSSAVTWLACSFLAPPAFKLLCLITKKCFFVLFLGFFQQYSSRRGKDRFSGHTEWRRGGEADNRRTGERHEGSFNQRHLLPPCCSTHQTTRWHPWGFTLQVPIQEEEEVQAAIIPEKEQEAEGEIGGLRHLDAPDLGEILLWNIS